MGDNAIRTSKYSALSFIPKNLLVQFKKASNLYFLIITFMQMIELISISNGKPAMAAPLVMVVIVSMVKDGYEDYKRHMNDDKENTSDSRCLDSKGSFELKEWQKLICGDIVKIRCDEMIPVDMLILHTSDAKGICYIETKNLDGETNLKTKSANKKC